MSLAHAMCGRFTQSYTWRELVELYRLTQPARNLRPRYNIAPTTAVDVVRLADTGSELVPMRWGLIPGWWKKTAKERLRQARRCLARTRRGTPCQSPAVAGKTRCRMHGGATGSGAPKGKRNGKYRHGGFTTEAIDERRRLASLIRDSRDFLSRLR
jgi:hypothetical protein